MVKGMERSFFGTSSSVHLKLIWCKKRENKKGDEEEDGADRSKGREKKYKEKKEAKNDKEKGKEKETGKEVEKMLTAKWQAG